MALAATAEHRDVIHRGRRPGKAGMTIVTGPAAGHMSLRLTRCNGAVVAAAAIHGRAFEDAAHMAIGTAQTLMLAAEGKAGIEVVEVPLFRRPARHHAQ